MRCRKWSVVATQCASKTISDAKIGLKCSTNCKIKDLHALKKKHNNWRDQSQKRNLAFSNVFFVASKTKATCKRKEKRNSQN